MSDLDRTRPLLAEVELDEWDGLSSEAVIALRRTIANPPADMTVEELADMGRVEKALALDTRRKRR